MTTDTCPHCGGRLKFLEKNTFSGRDIREYRCLGCGKSVDVDSGIALWQVLHDAGSAEPAAPERPWWRFWRR